MLQFINDKHTTKLGLYKKLPFGSRNIWETGICDGLITLCHNKSAELVNLVAWFDFWQETSLMSKWICRKKCIVLYTRVLFSIKFISVCLQWNKAIHQILSKYIHKMHTPTNLISARVTLKTTYCVYQYKYLSNC